MAYELWIVSGIGILAMYFCVNKFVVEGNNPYAFTQFFDKSLVKVKMYEVSPASYNEQVTKPLIIYKGVGLYGKDGLYFKNLYPVNKDFLIRAESGFYHFYYKSGGQKAVVPLLMMMFFSDSDKEKEMFGESEPVYAKGAGTVPEIFSEVKEESEGGLAANSIKKTARYDHMGFLTPAKEQLELMTDNFVDNFLTRQQSIAVQSLNNLDLLTKAIIPIGLFMVVSLVILATAMTFASNIVEDGVNAAASAAVRCPSGTPVAPPAQTNTSSQNGDIISNIFSGTLPS